MVPRNSVDGGNSEVSLRCINVLSCQLHSLSGAGPVSTVKPTERSWA